MTPHRPSLLAILRTDFLALAGAIAAPAGVGVAVTGALGFLPDRHRSMSEARLELAPAMGVSAAVIFAVAFVAAGIALVAWRASRIRAAFATGTEAPGVVTRIRPFRDRAYVHYAFTLDGQRHETRHFVHQSAAFKRLSEGQEVSIAVDPARPSVAFIAELFRPQQPT